MSPKNIKIVGMFFVVVIFTAVAAFSPSAFAADQPACNLSQDKFDELKAVENNASLNYLDEIREELSIRKQLLGETVDCAIEEADNLKINLNNTSVNDPMMQNLKKRFMDQIDSAENYFTLQKSKIGDLGLQGSKDFAKNFSDWRDGNYKPSAENAGNLIIWAGNQNLIQSARTRINQISNAVTLLKIVDNDEIQNLWNDAQTNFSDALKENQAAANSLLVFAQPEEPSAHIKSSLNSLSLTYKNFLDLVGTINKSLTK
jgi:hypothetical protein